MSHVFVEVLSHVLVEFFEPCLRQNFEPERERERERGYQGANRAPEKLQISQKTCFLGFLMKWNELEWNEIPDFSTMSTCGKSLFVYKFFPRFKIFSVFFSVCGIRVWRKNFKWAKVFHSNGAISWIIRGRHKLWIRIKVKWVALNENNISNSTFSSFLSSLQHRLDLTEY